MTNAQAGFCISLLGILFIAAAVILTVWEKNRVKKYSAVAVGTVIGHKWVQQSEISYPCAILSYAVDGTDYQCRQTYRSVNYNSAKHAKQDWELDTDYRLHSYVTRKCEKHVNPVEDWFPVGSQFPVYYIPKKPEKAYCGALSSLKLAEITVGCAGIIILLFGALLQFI